ncbi:hypothetical protein IW148_004696 [Coemansia sp. RSA 1199]|nr:hypothetical protein IW148_004696 [Coemansia sp. RSA 1199]
MVSFSALAASVLAFTSAVHAGFYTTYPIGSDALQAGQNIQITWRTDDQAPDLTNVGSYTLKFMTGGNFVQTTVATIGTFDIAQKTVSFTVPTTAPGMYFLMYTAEGGAGSSWSTRFSIGGGTTWYPEGVATGKDDDDKSSSPVEPSSSPAESSSSSTKSGGIGEPTDISVEKPSSSSTSDATDTTKPTDESSTGNTSKPAPTDDTTSGNSDTSDNQTDSGDNTDGSSPANTSDGNTDASSPAGSDASDSDGKSSELGSESDNEQASDDDSNADDESSDDKKSSSKDKSSSDDEDEDSDSSTGSMSRLLSGAAVLAASIFMI